uniref:Uncharacterized protein n=1 Tax=Rhizophora mucronata TaxID=61149 RepID=A0A2P2PK66_RHIMU
MYIHTSTGSALSRVKRS